MAMVKVKKKKFGVDEMLAMKAAQSMGGVGTDTAYAPGIPPQANNMKDQIDVAEVIKAGGAPAMSPKPVAKVKYKQKAKPSMQDLSDEIDAIGWDAFAAKYNKKKK